ncbi:HTH-type transcriptional activator IlvY [Alishewanella tabrizica]|uniref:Transcriptional regulator IlvY n=1 Tax=Alishewanella tabrizica TaxID=671278 RepID=A0ABQ2WSK2_9ALTE|nr:HTH-type transcriptional activator IlvY [Alishewanella tabrizica]GGW70204.1 transcriptional regulator IlvY [Alishewanella tabrizica]
MDIRSAQLFLHLASSLNYAKTSDQMFVSPSTLTRVIQRLEEELNVTLFERNKRSVQLTVAGERVQRFAKLWLEEWHQLHLDLQLASAELSGTLRIFCTVTASYSHLPALLDKFRLQCPKAEIQLSTGDASAAIERIRADEADVAIAAHPEQLPTNMFFKRISTVPIHLIAPVVPCRVNDLLAKQPINWNDIPMILPEHGPARSRVDQWLRDKQITPAIVAKVDGHEAMVSMVALGSGISIVPEPVLQLSPVRERVRILDPQYQYKPFELGICMLNKRRNEPLVQAFWQLILPN